MHVLVTGGAGYIGSVLVEHLLRADYDVTVVDNFMYGQMPLAHLCHNPKLRIIREDAYYIEKELYAVVDVVIPLAAIVGAPACEQNHEKAQTTLVDTTQDMIEHLPKDRPILVPITNSGYGIGGKDKECTEETPLRPISSYGRWKRDQEGFIMQRGNAISFRLATVFGMSPRMRTDLLVNDFVWQAVTNRAITLFEPNFKRNYIHVQDVARVFLFGLQNFKFMKDKIYNVGLSTANLSKMELCLKIRKQTPFSISVDEHGEDPDKRDYIVSNAKIEATGFLPRISIDEGISELIKGYSMFRRYQYGNI